MGHEDCMKERDRQAEEKRKKRKYFFHKCRFLLSSYSTMSCHMGMWSPNWIALYSIVTCHMAWNHHTCFISMWWWCLFRITRSFLWECNNQTQSFETWNDYHSVAKHNLFRSIGLQRGEKTIEKSPLKFHESTSRLAILINYIGPNSSLLGQKVMEKSIIFRNSSWKSMVTL